MKLYSLVHREQYEGDTILGIYDTAQRAQNALQEYLKEDIFNQKENLQIVETLLNEAPDWNYMDPELREYYKNSNV